MSEVSTVSTGRLRVVINKPACCGYGICAETCPEVYKLDENGIVYVDDPYVPAELEAKAREGAASCPQSALEIELEVEGDAESSQLT
jgi:ferredoxin